MEMYLAIKIGIFEDKKKTLRLLKKDYDRSLYCQGYDRVGRIKISQKTFKAEGTIGLQVYSKVRKRAGEVTNENKSYS